MVVKTIKGTAMIEVPFTVKVDTDNIEYKRSPQLYMQDLADNWINWSLYMDGKEVVDITFEEEEK